MRKPTVELLILTLVKSFPTIVVAIALYCKNYRFAAVLAFWFIMDLLIDIEVTHRKERSKNEN